MVRSTLPLLLAGALVLPLAGQGLEFDVASIKRNTNSDRPFGRPPDPATTGEVRLMQTPPGT